MQGPHTEGPRTIDNVSARDIAILKTRVDHPTATTRELSSILEKEYGIDLSHNRVNEILHELAEKDLYRKTILPSQDLFLHFMLSISFNFSEYSNSWEACFEKFLNDPHVMMFFNTDGRTHWQLITQFRSLSDAQRWVHHLWIDHGELFNEFTITDLERIHKFQTGAEIFDDILKETEQGRSYLDEGE